MSFAHHKKLFQAAIALLALIPLSTGLTGVLLGPAFVMNGNTVPADLDSHFRFLSAIFVGVGLMFYVSIPSIERKTLLFRIAAALVFAGGIARLVSLLVTGAPSAAHIAGLVMELAVVPALVFWQSRLSNEARVETVLPRG